MHGVGERGATLQQGVGQVKTHDGHPAEHGDCKVVAKVTNNCTKDSARANIVHSEKENIYTCDAENIAQDDSAMESVEIRNIPIDNEDDE